MKIPNGQICLLAMLSMLLSACIRGEFERPPDTRFDDPHLQPTHSIAELKALNGLYIPGTGGDTTIIHDDILISGVVVADDRSGNFYKQIVIQDSTGALFVNIDDYSLYARYPVGRRIYIRCKDLQLGYNGGMMELGSGLDEQLNVLGLSVGQAAEHIVTGAIGNAIADTFLSFEQAKAIAGNPASRALLGRLLTISDVQFEDSSQTYADPAATSNRMIMECVESPNRMVVRTSNFAGFRGNSVGKGRGSIRGIYTIYQSATTSTPQLLIRDTADVQMYNPRCGAVPLATLVSIDSMRRLYPGSGTYVLPAVQCAGTVISDLSKGNVSPGNFIVQDGSGRGFILYLSNGTYQMGDSLLLDVGGAKLQLYNGALEMTGMSSSKVTRVGTKRTVVPLQRTIAQLNADFARYESVLVKVTGGEIKGGGTYSGNKTLDDGTGNISLYTAAGATFAGNAVPGGKVSFIGIGTRYTYNEIKIRDPVIDVQ